MTKLKTTPLTTRQIEAGGRMVPFAGYSMPVQFEGLRAEHTAVRTNVGLFDVSHMGEIAIKGQGALDFVNTLVTHDLSGVAPGRALYCVMCHPHGGVVDDLLVYRLGEQEFMLCINASNRAKDFDHIQGLPRPQGLHIEDTSDHWAQLALQGPRALEIATLACAEDPGALAPFGAMWTDIAGARCLVSRTGYTGEDGVEIYIPANDAPQVWDHLVEQGHAFDMALCGLGCRDTLRLEAKMHLYGQDLDDQTTPLEAGLGWAVKFDKPQRFVGQQALHAQKQAGLPKRFRGLVLEGRAIARTGTPLWLGDQPAGVVTSGCHSPTLGQSIALGYIDAAHASAPQVEAEIRGKRVPARVTTKPFYRRPKTS